MSLEYTWTRDDLKDKLHKMRRVPNAIFLVLGIAFYLFVTWYGFMDEAFDAKIILLGFIIYFMGLLLLLLLATKIYVFLNLRRNDKQTDNAYGTYYVKADEVGINSEINDEKISYKWKDISEFKKSKDSFFIATKKDRLGLLFDKKYIKEDKYDRLLNFVEEQLREV